MLNVGQNWAANQDYGAAAIHHPDSVAEVQRLVAAGRRVRAVGARHSFSAAGATAGDLLLLDRLKRVLEIDPEQRTATIEAGLRYEELNPVLEEAGWALANLASLPAITVAGACATATHGSGSQQQLLAAAVSALDLVTAEGDLVTLTRAQDGDTFRSALVGLGALGVVVRLTLDLVPTFLIRQTVYEGLLLERLIADFAAIMESAYSVSIFTDWRGPTIQRLWVKRHAEATHPAADAPFFGALPAAQKQVLGTQATPDRMTQQDGIAGPWHERLPHFRAGAIAVVGDELQSEYFIDRQHAPAAIQALAALGEQLAPTLVISEIRTVAADNYWLSPFYQRESVGLHCTWQPDWSAVQAKLPLLEAALEPYAPRPHLGKLFTLPPAVVRSRLPRLVDFAALCQQYDPTGKFSNPFLHDLIGNS